MPQPALLLDTARIRAQFPAFGTPELADQAFFENAGGSYTASPVLDLLDHYYRASKVQPYGTYPASIAAGAAMDTAYARLAEALNVPADWLHFGPSTSANTYVLAKAFADWLQPGDAIIVTNQDHEANSGAWRKLAAHGIEVREWRMVPETGHLDLNTLERLLDPKVRLVAFPHASNIVGEINAAAEIGARAHAAGALAIVDGVSYAPHGLPDLASLGCDIYLFSAYKVYGPHQGVMAIRPELASELPNQGHYFNDKKLRYRLTPAGPDHAQVAASAGIPAYLEMLAGLAPADFHAGEPVFRRAHAAMRAQEVGLMAPLLDYLSARNDLRLIGPSAPQARAPTISLVLDAPGRAVATRLATHKVMAGGGHFYGVRTLEGLGVDPEHGVLRLSFVHYTSAEDITRLIAALDAELG